MFRISAPDLARVPGLALRSAGLAALLLLGAGGASAQVHPWTTVGSAGTVDEADLGIADLVLGEARMSAAAAVGSVLDLRYNVVSLEGFSGPGQYVLRTRFRDNGGAARVQATLRRYSLNGTSTTLHTFDSNTFAAAPNYQTQQQCVVINWDFEAGPHYFDVALTRSAAGGQPALAILQLVPANCIP